MAKVDCAEAGRRPPEVPAGSVVISGKKSGEGGGGGAAGEVSFPLEFPYDWVYLSELMGSKVEPAAGAAEEGCDGARAAARLGRRAAADFLREDDEADPPAVAAAAAAAGYSPMSTLSAAKNWNSSSKEVWMLPSLFPNQLGDEEAQLYAAAAGKQRRQGGQAILPSPAGFAQNAADGYYGYRQHKDAIAHIHQLKRQQLAELAASRRRNRAPKEGGGGAGTRLPARPAAGPSKGASWARHSLQAGAGMRAVFLGSVSGRESGGTGVFLPRQSENPADGGRKKPGLSTALLPVRVMPALNLNLDDFAAGPRSPGGSLLPQDAINARTIALMSRARSSGAAPAHAAGRRQPELCLPAEWTY